MSRAEVGIPVMEKPSTPWGVIMEMGYDKATVAVVAFADGTASIYLSSGGGFIGGGGHQTIRTAAQAFVAAAEQFQPQMAATKDFPEPQRGQTIFYLRTDDGVFTATAPENDLARAAILSLHSFMQHRRSSPSIAASRKLQNDRAYTLERNPVTARWRCGLWRLL